MNWRIWQSSLTKKSANEGCEQAISKLKNALNQLEYRNVDNEEKLMYKDIYLYTLKMEKRDINEKITVIISGPCANKTNIQSDNNINAFIILESPINLPERGEALTLENYGVLRNNASIQLRGEIAKLIDNVMKNENNIWKNCIIKLYEKNSQLQVNVITAHRYLKRCKECENKIEVGPGVAVISEVSNYVICNPEQNLQNIEEKNIRTKGNYKRYVRLVKSMRAKMKELGYAMSPYICSHGLESILWNVDDTLIMNINKLQYGIKLIMKHLLDDYDNWKDYKRIDGIEKLFASNYMIEIYKSFLTNMIEFTNKFYGEL